MARSATNTHAMELGVDVGGATDAEELDELTRSLRRDLLQLDVDSVEAPYEGPPPPGARAADILALGTLVITLAKNARALTDVVRSVHAWCSNDSSRSVKLQIGGDVLEVTGVSSEDQEKLIATWIERHSAAEA